MSEEVNKLLPCPFCDLDVLYFWRDAYHVIDCAYCDLRMYGSDKDLLHFKWNQRVKLIKNHDRF
jgi:hypothetical protein